MDLLGSSVALKIERQELWRSILYALRIAIVTGQLAPGTHLVEAQLAEELGVSRGPVRDALDRLEYETLVARKGHRGRFVAGFTVEDVHEVYSLRRLLESYAIEEGIKCGSQEDHGRARELLDDMLRFLSESEFEEMADVDLEFHRVFVASARNARLLGMWETLCSITHGLIVISASTAPDILRLVTETHVGMLDGFVAGDPVAARKAVCDHLLSAEALMADVIRAGKQRRDEERGEPS